MNYTVLFLFTKIYIIYKSIFGGFDNFENNKRNIFGFLFFLKTRNTHTNIVLKINQLPSHESEINICKMLDHHTSPK